jgi:Domain of unknown function (DUF6398)
LIRGKRLPSGPLQISDNMDKQKLQIQQQEILDLVRDFCAKKLDEEYFRLTEKLVQKLGQKRYPPFITGQTKIWAAAVIHAIGTNNFLFDSSFEPYVTVDELNNFFGTNKSTTGTKSKLIRDLLKLGYWDPEFSTTKMLESSPANVYVLIDGFMVRVDSLPDEFQELVRKSRAEGKDISFTTR